MHESCATTPTVVSRSSMQDIERRLSIQYCLVLIDVDIGLGLF